MTSLQNNLKPALLIGTGFHRYVLGDVAPHESYAPLVDWNALISAVARRAQVSVPTTALPPVMRWEALVHDCVRHGFQARKRFIEAETYASYKVELYLKQWIAEILGSISDYPQGKKGQFPLSGVWGAVVSLNYDQAWCSDVVAPKTSRKINSLTSAESKRLLSNSVAGNTRLWFPNGCVARPDTIRIGLRDYGIKAFGIEKQVATIKKFERRHFSHDDRIAMSNSLQAVLINGLDGWCERRLFDFGTEQAERDLPISWVTELFYRPLAIAGCGLSESETGLWYLLSQRQRNFARLDAKMRPPVRILLSAKDTRRAFWETKPFGVEPVFCSNWDEGWLRMQALFEKESEQ